jgi:2-phosphosulfolactate phosphatase
MTPTVAIDCFHDHLPPARSGEATVAVDVIRATTTALTALATGRRVFLAPSIEAAVPLAARLSDPLLAGELGGFMPYGFDLQNSPSAVAEAGAPERPMILLSTSGTRLMVEAAADGEAYAASLRNVSAQVDEILERHEQVRLLGADSRGEFRPEDQLCCARIARRLVTSGYKPADARTEAVLERWGDAPDDAFLDSPSISYLRETDQERDLRFVLEHIDDLRAVFPIIAGEIRMRAVGEPCR